MRNVKTIEWLGLDHLIHNKNYYKEMFLNNKIIAFRNVNADVDLQKKIMIYFGDLLGWYPNSSNSNPSDYVEDHHRHMRNENVSNKNELMLGWHIEWVQNEEDPHYGATWNMTKFDCDYDTGNTCFIDAQEVYEMLDKKSIEFLKKCKVFINFPEQNFNNKKYQYIKQHWITKENCVRPFLFNPTQDQITSLVEFDNKTPTKEDISIFDELHKKICNIVYHNEDIRYVHKWEKGDLLVPDLFKLAHSVTGGFKENQRRLDGMFGKSNAWDLKQ